MRIRTIVFTCVFALNLAASATTLSQETNTPRQPNTAMQEYMKLMMPGEGHKLFAKFAGKWTGKMKVWNSTMPNRPPDESTEEAEAKLILGGRFLAVEAKGSLMGMAMQRLNLLGYDNYTKQYTQVFMSSMGTATNIATGAFDASGKVLTLRGEFNEPEGKYAFKNVIRIESDDVQVFESYRIEPDGKEIKVIEQVSTRVK